MSRNYICDACKRTIGGKSISVREKVYISRVGEAPTKAVSVTITDYCDECYNTFCELKDGLINKE